jgi:hypothetical protein
MRDELSGKRPSPLSSLFREQAADGMPLADWTRHVDGDWIWYCPVCQGCVVLIEEKTERSPQRSWTVTRRLATGHEDRPWGWRVTCLDDGTFAVTGARMNGNGHESFGERAITKADLVGWIVRAFDQHYVEAGHQRAA